MSDNRVPASDRVAAAGRVGTTNDGPVNTVLPVISGNTYQGQTLTTTDGTWTGTPTPTYTYTWSHGDGSAAAGTATNSTYVLAAGDTDYTMRCQVAARNIVGSVAATSSATVAIAICSVSPFAWWTCSTAYCFTDAAKTTPCGDTDLIYVTADRSGNGRDVSQATSGNRFTFRTGIQNGRPVMRIAAGSQSLFVTGLSMGANRSMFCVSRASVQGFVCGIGDPALTGGVSRILLLPAVPKTVLQGNGSDVDPAWTTLASNVFEVQTFIQKNSTSEIMYAKNGAALSTQGGRTTAAFTSKPLYIGASEVGGGTHVTGDVCELVLYDSALSAGDAALVQTYLNLWGVY